MNKILSLSLALAASLSVNAQEVCQIDAESAGITTGDDNKGVDITAGTVVGTSENLTITVLNDEKVKPTSCKMSNSGFEIGGAAVSASGITGNSNPKDANGYNPATGDGTTGIVGGVPVTGFAISITTSASVADGSYLYVCGKLSSNKNYYVFENGQCIGYDLAMWCDDAAQFQPLKITVANDAEADGVPYRTASIAWPEVIFTGDANSAVKKNGEGVIVFPVYPECTYVVGAGGSKISVCGAVLTSSNTVSVVLPETTNETTGETTAAVTMVAEGSTPGASATGISAVSAEKAAVNAPIYNLAGQRVSKATKGLYIQNGKKYVK